MNRKSVGLGASLAVMIALAGYFAWQETVIHPVAPTSVAVLAFADLSPGGDYGYLAEGIAEELINALARVPELRVTARTSSFVFRGKNMDIREIGRQLGVDVVVEGSIQRSNGRLRITVQLIDTEDGFHLFSDTWDRPFDELFAIQDDVVRSVADGLRVTLLRGTGRPPSGDVRAYELSIRGDAFVHEHNTKSLRLAVDHFERALKIDPNFSYAYSGLSSALASLWNHQDWYPEIEQPDRTANSPFFQQALHAAKRSIELDPELPESHGTLGYLLWAGLHDFPAAARELEIARKLKSDSVWPSFDRSLLSAELGRLSEAREQIDRALEIDPLSPLVTQVAGEIYYLSGEYDAAIELLERAEGAGHGVAPLLLFTYIALGRADELFQLSLSALPPDAPDAVREGLVRAFDQGGIPGLLRYRIELERTTSDRSCGDNPFLTAAFLAVLEEKEQVFACLAEAERRNTLTWVKSEPLFAQYRDDPRFVAMLGRLGVL